MDWKANSHRGSHFLKPCLKPIFLCNPDLHHLDNSFIGALEILVLENKTIKKNFFFDIETTIEKTGQHLGKTYPTS